VSELLHHVEQSILVRRLFRPRQRVLVAVSGGVDSMVLLHVLHKLARKHGWRLTVAHFNHRLRGRSSDADERLVRRTAERLGLPVVVEAAGVRELARAQGISLEMAARKLRHDFLARTARRQNSPFVALAHHADDQLELFFLRLLRGSGGDGLAGMKWRNPSPTDAKVQLVRPLLDQTKAVLCEYAAEQRIRFREDASNAQLDFQRNRIRHELLPLLRRKYQPALDRTISRAMEIVGAEAEFVGQAAEEWLRWLGSPKSEGQRPKEGRRAKSEEVRASSRRLLREEQQRHEGLRFDDLPVAVQRRCMQIQLLRLGIEPDYELLEQLRVAAERSVSLGLKSPGSRARTCVGAVVDSGSLRLCLSPSEGERIPRTNLRFAPLNLVGTRSTAFLTSGKYGDAVERVPTIPKRFRGRVPCLAGEQTARGKDEAAVLCYAVRDRWGRVRLQAAAVEEFNSSSAKVSLERRAGEVEFDGARISWRVDFRKGVTQRRAGVRQESFDADKVGSLVRLRHWQPGDRFQPIGMACPVKLQDFLTNQKIPRDRRRQLVVAATAQGEVFWVEGTRISERFKLTRQTIRRLQWRWERL
jgi:tRNA(Ile)-lysidine synthase